MSSLMGNVFILKVVLTLAILGLGFYSVFAPRHLAGAPHLFSYGNMMASGVLLAAGLVHQLPDSSETLNLPGKFPLASFVAGCTFVAFLVLEEGIHLIMSHDVGDLTGTMDGELCCHQVHELNALANEESQYHHIPPPCEKNTRSVSESSALLSGVSHETEATPTKRVSISCSNRSHHPKQIGDWLRTTGDDKTDPLLLSEHHHHNDHIDLHLHGSVLASGVLMVALSIHSILAGVSIGIENSPESVTSTAIAILAHKMFEGFCLGSSLVNAEVQQAPFFILGTVWSCATPFGIVLGQILSDWSSEQSHSIAIVQAMVAGTFLYIAIFEIGMKELLICRHSDDKSTNRSEKVLGAIKLVCFVGGFLAMSGLAVFI